MSFPDAIAFCALVLGLICISAILLEGYKRRLSNRERELELKVRQAASQTSAAAGPIEDMEQRLRVLERIATDSDAGLAREIENLRPRPQAMEVQP